MNVTTLRSLCRLVSNGTPPTAYQAPKKINHLGGRVGNPQNRLAGGVKISAPSEAAVAEMVHDEWKKHALHRIREQSAQAYTIEKAHRKANAAKSHDMLVARRKAAKKAKRQNIAL